VIDSPESRVLTAPGAAGKSVDELGAADLPSEFALGCRLWFGSHLDVWGKCNAYNPYAGCYITLVSGKATYHSE